jgi:hypothetical protein
VDVETGWKGDPCSRRPYLFFISIEHGSDNGDGEEDA